MTRKAKPVLIFLGAILVALFPLSRWIASVYLRNAPRTYFSVVTIEIKLDLVSRAHALGSDSQFRAAEIQRLKTAEILTPVIERLDLVKKLSPPGMMMPMQWVTEVLLRSIVVQEKKNTTLVEIGVYHTDKQLAADIANTIAVTYRDKCIEVMRKNMDLTLAEMKDELKTKREEMGRLFQEASRIRQEDEIVDPDPERADAVLSIKTQIDEKTRMNRYVEKKSAYLMTKQLLLMIQQRHDVARVYYTHDTVPVKIWQRAEPAQTPARPDAVHILRCANVIGGSLAAIGMLLILIGVCVPSWMFPRSEMQE